MAASTTEKAVDIDALGEEPLDLEAVIADFANDSSQDFLVLPASLSPDERLNCKSLVGRYETLDCKSIGFGAERSLHIFRRRGSKDTSSTNSDAIQSTAAPDVKLKVKNTFIHAWLDENDGKLHSSGAIIRTCPADFRHVLESIGSLSQPMKSDGDVDFDGTSCSTAVERPLSPDPFEHDAPCLIANVSCPAETQLKPTMPTGMEGNRPTALSDDSLAKPDCQSQAPREQHLLPPELLAQNLPPPPTSPVSVAPLQQGTEVEIDGLVQQPAFNGLVGVVQSWDPEMRRYDVLLSAMPDGSGQRRTKLKRENLRQRTPPPPLLAATTTILLDSCIEQPVIDAASPHYLQHIYHDGSAYHDAMTYHESTGAPGWNGHSPAEAGARPFMTADPSDVSHLNHCEDWTYHGIEADHLDVSHLNHCEDWTYHGSFNIGANAALTTERVSEQQLWQPSLYEDACHPQAWPDPTRVDLLSTQPVVSPVCA